MSRKNNFHNPLSWVNIGMILLLSVDRVRSSNSLMLHLAKKNNTFSDRGILSTGDYLSPTELMAN